MKLRSFDLPYNVISVIAQMEVGDWFHVPATDERFTLTVCQTMFKGSVTIAIKTFKCNGRDYKCNVWNHQDIYYIQEM
jgi:hypothetical protein